MELIEKIQKDLKENLSEKRYTHSIGVMNMAVELATFPCKYFFGTMKEDIFKCSSPKLTLKLVDGDTRYYDLSLKLEG